MVVSGFSKCAVLQKLHSLFLGRCAVSLETSVTYNEISTSSAYGSPHPVGPLLLSHIVGNVSPYKSNGRSEIRGASRAVFVGRRRRLWESDRERAEGLFPSVTVSSAERQGSAHRSPRAEGGQTLCGIQEQRCNADPYQTCATL